MIRTRALLAAALAALLSAGAASAEDHGPLPHREKWTFSGMFGTFDQAQLQRGFQVYREVCSNCHSLNYIRFRNLEQEGGPDFSAAQVKALAAEYKVKDGPNDSGDMFERPGRPGTGSGAVPNEQVAAAAANGGKAPPDLSLMAKARTFARGGVVHHRLAALHRLYRAGSRLHPRPPQRLQGGGAQGCDRAGGRPTTTSSIRATSSRCPSPSATVR